MSGKPQQGWHIKELRQPSSDQLQTPISSVNTPTDETTRIFTKVILSGREYMALIDTGSSRSYISEKTAKELRRQGIKFYKNQSQQAQLANGDIVKIPEQCEIGTSVGAAWKKFTFLCLPQLTTAVLLGMDALRLWKMTLRFDETPSTTPEALWTLFTQPWERNDKGKLEDFLKNELPQFEKLTGHTTLTQHNIRLKDPKPLKQRYMPRNPKMMEIINSEVDQMLKDGVIEPSKSPWSSPTVIVRKKDGKYRFCIDFRRLNEVTEKDAYPLPFIHSILDRLREAKYFSTLDLKQGYWQVPLTNASKPLTAFTVPGRGLFQFRVMPFGLHAAPATFQRLLESIIDDTMDYAFAYIDDIIVFSNTLEDHLQHLGKVFEKLRKANLKLNPEKCHFAQNSIKYLGHVVSENGIETDPDKVAAIEKIPPPRNVREVRQILGAASWYRRFIGGFSELITPLTRLLKKDQKWSWSTEEQKAFEKLKTALTTAPVLACPNFKHPFILQTDASEKGIGTALIQRIDSKEHVIAYASRTLQKAEQNYSTTEKECLAIVWGVQKMRPYLEGYQFTVITDHQALQYLHRCNSPSGRLARWAVYLQQFDMKIEYRKGSLNQLADTLSRQPLPHKEDEPNTDELLAIKPHNDWYKKMYDTVTNNPKEHPDYKIINGKLYRHFWEPNNLAEEYNPETEWKRCVPPGERLQVQQENHDAPHAGHMGIAKTLNRIMRQYYWPGMNQDVVRYVRACKKCQQYKFDQNKAAGNMSQPNVRDAWETVSTDIVGPLPRSKKGNAYLVAFQDRLTKFVECRALRRATGATITQALRELVINRYGCPKAIMTDNGTEFNNKQFKGELETLGIQHYLTPPYTPQANPVERVNRVLKPMLAIYCDGNQRTWDEYLPELTYAINTSRHDSTGYTPAYLNFGRELRMPREDYPGDIDVTEQELPPEYMTRMKKLRDAQELARTNIARSATRQAHHYNLRRRDWSPPVGDKVMRREHPLSVATKGFAAKLAPRYSGPWTVVRKRSPQVCDLRGTTGRQLKRIHVKDLKPFNP